MGPAALEVLDHTQGPGAVFRNLAHILHYCHYGHYIHIHPDNRRTAPALHTVVVAARLHNVVVRPSEALGHHKGVVVHRTLLRMPYRLFKEPQNFNLGSDFSRRGTGVGRKALRHDFRAQYLVSSSAGDYGRITGAMAKVITRRRFLSQR